MTATATEAPKSEPALSPEQIQLQKDKELIEALTKTLIDPREASKHTKALIFGAFFTGKTIWSCDAPGKVLYVAIERGASAILNHPEIEARTKVMQFKTINQVELLPEALNKGFEADRETIVLDTFSELQKKDLDSMIDEGWRKNPLEREHRYSPEGKDYQGNTEHMRRIAAAFRDVDRNVIFVCHEKIVEDKNTKVQIVGPDLTAKVMQKLNEYCDVVGRATADWKDEKNPQFSLQVRPGITQEGYRLVAAKTRITRLPSNIQNSTFAQLHRAKLIKEETNE